MIVNLKQLAKVAPVGQDMLCWVRFTNLEASEIMLNEEVVILGGCSLHALHFHRLRNCSSAGESAHSRSMSQLILVYICLYSLTYDTLHSLYFFSVAFISGTAAVFAQCAAICIGCLCLG